MESPESTFARVVRVVSAFDKKTERLVDQMKLFDVDLAMLQALFHIPADNPMYDSSEVGPAEVAVLRDHVDGEFDLDRYDYFVDCDLPALREEAPVSTGQTTAATL